MFVPRNNGRCNKSPVDEAVNDPYGLLIIDTTEIITVSTGEELHTNHVIYGLLGTLYLSVK